jgi:Ca-activated chloride channel family protein
MKTNLDDPKLTAYALGELEGEDRAAMEALLVNSPEARRQVDEIRQTAQRLETELQKEPCPVLTTKQTKAIENELVDREENATTQTQRDTKPWFLQLIPSFRLVEVIIVVGLIAVLAALFLPSLAASKKKAQRVLATGQLREMSMQSMQRLSPNRMKASGDMSWGLIHSPARPGEFNTETYNQITDNPFLAVSENPLSTFSIDVDTASYAIVRRFLNEHRFPPKDAVRIEEMINYFTYDYRPPTGEDPFSVNVEIAGCPWNSEHRLARVGLKGREIAQDKRPPSNLVFLVDVSGSMQPANKLPLLKQCLKMLTEQLTENDHVSIVVYAGAAGEVLPATSGDNHRKILRALEQLEAGGSTHGSEGVQLAYETAVANFIPGGVNRVILCTDGDFNVGVTNPGDLVRLIEEKAKSGVFLTVLGFGMGNYKDGTVEMLADKGNGNYAYIDTLNEGRKVLVEQMSGTLVTIAKDVKIQVEFNPSRVSSYRLIGYENRLLRKEDFNDDKKDAGEIGAGHTVTALYEIVPAGKNVGTPGVDPLKYQQPGQPSAAANSPELFTVKLRYKEPDGDSSKLMVVPVNDNEADLAKASDDFKFVSAVAAFGMILRDSPYKGTATLNGIWELANEGKGRDREGYREEFLRLVEQAKTINNARQD